VVDGPSARVALDADPPDVEAVNDLLAALQERGMTTLVAWDPLLRHVARQAGFGGDLRGDLRAGTGTGTGTSATLADGLAELVDGVRVVARPVGGGFKALIRSAVSGLPAAAEFDVTDVETGRTLRVLLPTREDLMIEGVACAVDTAERVTRRFGKAMPPLRVLSIDHSSSGLRDHRHAGESSGSAAQISLSASLVCAEEYVKLQRTRAVRPARHPSAAVRGPFTVIDGVTAHEMWHQMEHMLEAVDYRASIEFRRALGAYFGLATLEHVVDGRRPNASEAARAANERLVAEVSPYAGSARLEATAEMFKLWWCAAEPPTGVIKFFGELVERYFPPPARS
jgi:hypothetical protein